MAEFGSHPGIPSTNVDENNGGYILNGPWTPGACTVTELWAGVNHTSSANNFRICIYKGDGTAGAPSTLLFDSASQVAPLTNAKEFLGITGLSVALDGTTSYWLGFGSDSSAYGYSYQASGSYPYEFTAFPAPGTFVQAGTTAELVDMWAVYTAAGPTTQIVAPSADISIGTWLAEPGDGTTNLWDQINETVLSATDYIQSSQSPVAADIYKVRIAPLQAPVKPRSDSAFHFRVDHLKDVAGGDSMQLTVKLYAADGTTLIKAWTPIVTGAETTSDLTLTGAEADTIPDADFAVGLVLAFEALKV